VSGIVLSGCEKVNMVSFRALVHILMLLERFPARLNCMPHCLRWFPEAMMASGFQNSYFSGNLEKSGLRKNDQERQRICLVRENCPCNQELDTHNHDLFNVL
jgi:hypothetical protein